MDCIKPYLPFSDFYNEPLSDAIEMDKDYTNYKSAIRIESSGTSSSRGDGKLVSEKYFSFITYPFILTPATKTVALFYDNRIRMYSERRNSVLHAISGLPPNPYLKLQVRRDHLIEDALMRVCRRRCTFLASHTVRKITIRRSTLRFHCSWSCCVTKALKISRNS